MENINVAITIEPVANAFPVVEVLPAVSILALAGANVPSITLTTVNVSEFFNKYINAFIPATPNLFDPIFNSTNVHLK